MFTYSRTTVDDDNKKEAPTPGASVTVTLNIAQRDGGGLILDYAGPQVANPSDALDTFRCALWSLCGFIETEYGAMADKLEKKLQA